jgi:hypothetical protein
MSDLLRAHRHDREGLQRAPDKASIGNNPKTGARRLPRVRKGKKWAGSTTGSRQISIHALRIGAIGAGAIANR